MIIFNIDDEPVLLKQSEAVLQDAVPDAEIFSFCRAADALSAVTNQKKIPQVVFCDIEMPGMDGLSFAEKIKHLCPETVMIFVTGYSQYALKAYRVHAHGYILKPLEKERVLEELAAASIPYSAAQPEKLQVRCFGYFEVFWNGEPLIFARRQTKELLAFLIDREGKICLAEEIIAALWEDETNIRDAKTRLRNLISDLKNTLESIGMQKVLLRHSGQLAIRPDLIECDYYRMLDGDVSAINSYRGLYMSQYSWAEITAGSLYFNMNRI